MYKVPTNLVHVVVGPGRGRWDRKSQQIMEKSNNPTSQLFQGDENILTSEKTETEMTALARSIDLKGG